MSQTLSNLWKIYRLMSPLNSTIFRVNPITFTELYQWIEIHGTEKTLSDLKAIWDRHNDYDVETL